MLIGLDKFESEILREGIHAEILELYNGLDDRTKTEIFEITKDMLLFINGNKEMETIIALIDVLVWLEMDVKKRYGKGKQRERSKGIYN